VDDSYESVSKVIWIATLNELNGIIIHVIGVYSDPSIALREMEQQAGKQNWQRVGLPDAPGDRKFMLSCLLEDLDLSLALYPLAINATEAFM